MVDGHMCTCQPKKFTQQIHQNQSGLCVFDDSQSAGIVVPFYNILFLSIYHLHMKRSLFILVTAGNGFKHFFSLLYPIFSNQKIKIGYFHVKRVTMKLQCVTCRFFFSQEIKVRNFVWKFIKIESKIWL